MSNPGTPTGFDGVDPCASVLPSASPATCLSGVARRPITLVGQEGLEKRGIHYSRSHLWRLEAEGRFPRRVKLGNGRVAWLLDEIDDYLLGLAAARDAAPSAPNSVAKKSHEGDRRTAPVELGQLSRRDSSQSPERATRRPML